MKQVIEEMRNGRVTVIDSPFPRCGALDVLVQTRASLISPGTEKLMIETGKKSLAGKAMARPDLVRIAYDKAKREGFLSVFKEAMARLDTPLPLGYSSSGTVVAVGANVSGFAVGDQVACAGSAFASHAEYVAVPQELCVRLNKGSDLSHEEAAFVMLGGIAMQGIRCGNLSFGETVVVVGLGLIGLITTQIARAYGCTVIGIDIDPSKVALAKKLGCSHALTLGKSDVDARVLNLTNGRGADAVLLTAATKDNSPILLAERITRQGARIVLVGVSDIHLTRKMFWDKELIFTVSKASGPSEQLARQSYPADLVRWTERRNHEEFVRLLEQRLVDVKSLITHHVPIAEATKAYDMILRGREHYIGVIIDYPKDAAKEATVRLKARAGSGNSIGGARTRVGLIGAGMFTRNVFLPVLAKTEGISFAGVAANTGLSASHIGKRFGFEYVTTDYQQILQDKSVGSVFIMTRHNLHATMIRDALKAGKNVFVEKPMAISKEEAESLEKAFHTSSKPSVMIGFNRRYSPLALEMATFFAERTSPIQVVCRVNASYIPPDHWTQDPTVGGGRIVGEACHFIDFIQFLTGADPVSVEGSSIDGQTGKYIRDDNVSLSIRMSDGSLGTVIYTALGSKAYSRERIEAYGEERVAVLEDFRTLELVHGAKKTRKKLGAQDMGYRGEIDAFFALTNESSHSLFRQGMLTTLTSIAAVESVKSGKRIQIAGDGSSQ